MKKNRSKYGNEYIKDHYRRVSLELKFEDYDEVKAVADELGIGVSTLIKQVVSEKIDKIKAENK